MKKIVITLLTFALCYPFSVFAQSSNYGLSSVKLSLFTNDSGHLELIARASFNMGPEAPPLSGYHISNNQDTLAVNLYYNVSGAWNTVFSVRIDTIPLGVIPAGINFINVVSGIVHTHSGNTSQMDTVDVYDSLISLHPTGIQTLRNLNADLKIAPNPVSGYLHIQAKQGLKINQLSLTDLQGRVLKSYPFWKGTRINLTGLPSGMYFLKIQTQESGICVFKVLKE